MSQRHSVAIIAGQLVVGGAEQQLFLWLSYLDRDKYQPVVVTLHPGYSDYWENYIESLSIPLIRIPRRRIRFVRLLDIVKALRPYKPKLIHGWHLFTNPYAGLAAKFLGAKSLGGVRSSFQAFYSNSLESNLTLHLVDAVLVNSNAVAEQFRAVRRHKKQDVYVVQNAVEDQVFDRLAIRQKLSRDFGVSSADIWIGSLGRLYPDKRFDLILKAIALLKENATDFHLFLIGDGPERKDLKRSADELGIDKLVTFTGEVPHAKEWLNALDIFCFASTDEGLPNVIMEAAAAKLPIVAWRLQFNRELIDDKMALLVDSEDFAGFKDALHKLLRSSGQREELGGLARSHILKEFSVQQMVHRMDSVYEDLLGSPKSSNSG